MRSSWKRLLLVAGGLWVAFFALLAAAYWLPIAQWADGWAVDGFLYLQRPWLSDIAFHVAQLANPLPFACWTILLAAIALYRRRPRQAATVVALLVGANVLAQLLKIALQHDRTHEFLGTAQLNAASFPSGHATASMALAFAAVLVAPPAWRAAVAVVGSLFALAVSESIMLLAWHFPSDVAGGFLVATACTLTTVAALRFAEQRWPERTGREAAIRVIGDLDLRRIGSIVGGFVLVGVAAVAVAAGDQTVRFADHHTTALAAVIAVAAMAAALPVSVTALGAPRSER